MQVNQIIQNNILQHAFAVNDNLLAVAPVPQGSIYDGHGATGPLVLIGFLGGEPVYRTTHTAAHHMEKKGAFRIHWPPLFPSIWLPECEYMQLDVTIRSKFASEIPSVEADKNHAYDDDDIYAWHNHQQQQPQPQQQIEPSDGNVDDADQEWNIIDDINNEWVEVDSIDH